jgi:hypothetical protein
MDFGSHNHCPHLDGRSLPGLIFDQLVICRLKALNFFLAPFITLWAGGRNGNNILVGWRAARRYSLSHVDENGPGSLDPLALSGSRPTRSAFLVCLLPLCTLPWCYDFRTRLRNYALGLGSRRLTLLLRLLVPNTPFPCTVLWIVWLYCWDHRWRWWARQ